MVNAWFVASSILDIAAFTLLPTEEVSAADKNASQGSCPLKAANVAEEMASGVTSVKRVPAKVSASSSPTKSVM